MIRQLSYLILLALCCLQACDGGPVRNPRQSEDNCGHPFHSFLCNKAPRSRVFNTPQSAASAISSFVAVPTKLPSSYDSPIEGENSFLDPTFITTTTTRKLSTTVRTTTIRSVPIISGDSSISDPVFLRPRPSIPPPPRPLEAQAAVLNPVKTIALDNELCSHPFHSFLCQPGRRSGSRRIITGKLPPSYKGENSFLDAVSIKTTPSAPPPPPVEVPEASFQSPTFYKPTTTIQKPTSTTPRPTQRRTTPRPTTTTPKPTTPEVQPEVPEASFDSPSFFKPEPPRTTQPPRTTVRFLSAAPQQIVVVTAQPEHYKGQNPCDHAFHSYLCQPGSGSRRRNYGRAPVQPSASNQQPAVIKPTTTTTRAPEVPEYSFLDAVAIKTTPSPPPPPPVEVPEASFQSPTFYKPTTTIQKPTSTTPRPTQRRTTPRPTTTTPKPTTPEVQPEVPEASFDSPSFFKPEPPRTTQPPRTTVRFLSAAPQQIVVVTAQPEHYKGQNPCDHAFHSYLCQPGSGSRRRNYGRAPVQPSASNQQPAVIKPTTTTTRAPEVPEYSFLDAVAIKPALTQRKPPASPTTTTTTTQRSTSQRPTTQRSTPRPTTPPPPPIEAAPSSDIFSGILPPKPVIQVSANTVKNRVEAVDKCKHAFHSFLCQPARPRKIQLQPAPSNIEGSLLLPAFRTTTTKRPTPPPTTTRPPPTRTPQTRAPQTRPPPTTEEVAQFPDASFQDPQRIALPPKREPLPQEPFPAPTSQQQNELLPAQFVRGPTDIADKCSHPFHGYLCKKAPRARRPIRIN